MIDDGDGDHHEVIDCPPTRTSGSSTLNGVPPISDDVPQALMMVTMVLMIMTEVVSMMSMLRRRKRKGKIKIHAHDGDNTK